MGRYAANTEKRDHSRTLLEHTYCLVEDIEPQFEVVEISAEGFSFVCDRDFNTFKADTKLSDITLLDSEAQVIIHATGVVRHRSEFDARRDRVGVSFESKRFENTVAGKVRLPRRRPSIELSVLMEHAYGETKGTVIDYNVRSARVAVDGQVHFAAGDSVLLAIRAARRRLYDGAATVIRSSEDDSEIVVEFTDNLLELRTITLTEKVLFANEIIDEKRHELEAFAAVSPRYKALVSDWRMYLEMVEGVLDREEGKGFLLTQEDARLYLEEILPHFTAKMREFITELNSLAPSIVPNELAAYKQLLRARLERFMRRSPVGSSVMDRMHGYLGDFETVKHFFADPFSGSTLFGKLINRFIMSLEPVVAHVNRIEYLYREILKRYNASESGIRVLSLGSGPAEEILRLFDNQELEKRLHVTLIDMDAHALADFYERAQYRRKRNVEIELVNFNILRILVGEKPDLEAQSYDITYCAGMFDYFKDRFCRKLVDFIVGLTAPGGNFYYTNVHSRNFARYYMDFAGGWEIYHRNEEETLKLAPASCPCEVCTDETATNVFVKGTRRDQECPNGDSASELALSSARART